MVTARHPTNFSLAYPTHASCTWILRGIADDDTCRTKLQSGQGGEVLSSSQTTPTCLIHLWVGTDRIPDGQRHLLARPVPRMRVAIRARPGSVSSPSKPRWYPERVSRTPLPSRPGRGDAGEKVSSLFSVIGRWLF